MFTALVRWEALGMAVAVLGGVFRGLPGVDNVAEGAVRDTEWQLRIQFGLPIYGSEQDPAAG